MTGSLHPGMLAGLSAESEREFHSAFVVEVASGRIQFTSAGRLAYGARFARTGVDIGKVRNRGTLREACLQSEWVIYEEIRQRVKSHKALEAILEPLWS